MSHRTPIYLERGDAVAILLIVVPLAFILESIGSLRHTKTRSLVVLPLACVGLHHVGVQLLVLRGARPCYRGKESRARNHLPRGRKQRTTAPSNARIQGGDGH